ncbi:TPA: zinc chelation protein SecC, partial [Klebsiella pneumoniae]|nr:zinc chelation protein SecC [Klebsiella pneumoniae]
KQGYINELLMQGVRMHVYDLGLISHDYNNYNAITVNEIIEI